MAHSVAERNRSRRPLTADEAMYAEDVGARLRELRREAGLTQKQLARRAGVHRNTVNLLEHGLRRARRKMLFRLVNAMFPKGFPYPLVSELVELGGPAIAPDFVPYERRDQRSMYLRVHGVQENVGVDAYLRQFKRAGSPWYRPGR